MITTQEIYQHLDSQKSLKKKANSSIRNSKSNFYQSNMEQGFSIFENSSLNSELNTYYITKSQNTPKNAVEQPRSRENTSPFKISRNVTSTNQISSQRRMTLKLINSRLPEVKENQMNSFIDSTNNTTCLDSQEQIE